MGAAPQKKRRKRATATDGRAQHRALKCQWKWSAESSVKFAQEALKVREHARRRTGNAHARTHARTRMHTCARARARAHRHMRTRTRMYT